MNNSREKKDSKTHSAAGKNAHVVQQLQMSKTKYWFFLEMSHTFNRIKDNSSIVVDWFFCSFRRGWGSAPWVLGTPDLWGDTVESHRSCHGSEWQHDAELENRVVSAAQHTNTLVRLLKRSSHDKQRTGKERFNVQRGQHNAREECTVETRQASLSPVDMKTELQDSFVIPLSSQIIINETTGNIKRMRQFKEKKTQHMYMFIRICV